MTKYIEKEEEFLNYCMSKLGCMGPCYENGAHCADCEGCRDEFNDFMEPYEEEKIKENLDYEREQEIKENLRYEKEMENRGGLKFARCECSEVYEYKGGNRYDEN